MNVKTEMRFRAYLGACTMLMCLAGVQASGQSSQHGHADTPGTDTHKPSAPAAKSPAGSNGNSSPKFGGSVPARSAHTANTAQTAAPSVTTAHAQTGTMSWDEALTSLREGNLRWVNGTMENPNSTSSRREETVANGQHPYAIVLSCADSRVPLERVFDCGVGDVFGLRVAGNIVQTGEAGSIEYAVEHLHVPVIVVMGHTGCGAVAAAASDAELHGNLGALVDHIEPAVERARSCNPGLEGKELTSAAVRENVWQSVFDLLNSSELCREMVKNGQVKVVGALYDLESGKVDWMGEHPWQKQLVTAMESEQTAQAGADMGQEPQTVSERSEH